MDSIFTLTVYKGKPLLVPGTLGLNLEEVNELSAEDITVIVDPLFDVLIASDIGEDDA